MTTVPAVGERIRLISMPEDPDPIPAGSLAGRPSAADGNLERREIDAGRRERASHDGELRGRLVEHPKGPAPGEHGEQVEAPPAPARVDADPAPAALKAVAGVELGAAIVTQLSDGKLWSRVERISSDAQQI